MIHPKYGPWAGKIIAGAEGLSLVYAIDSAGTFTSFVLNGLESNGATRQIKPEDIDLIPAD